MSQGEEFVRSPQATVRLVDVQRELGSDTNFAGEIDVWLMAVHPPQSVPVFPD